MKPIPSSDSVLKQINLQRDQLHRLGVRRLALFGSAARNEAGDTSDLDFLVELDRKTFDAYMDVKEFLERLFGRLIDLVTIDAVKPRLRSRIFQEAVYAEGLQDPA